jgi:NAD(P)-dependent dehydrogenase (short-subunit alcohol dehydrogenase family)
MKLGIEGRRALIAGSSSGIGAGIAAMLAGEGVEILVHGRSLQNAEEVVARIRGSGGRASAVIAALDEPQEVERLAAEALATGPIDILINSAGATTSARDWFDVPVEGWQQQFQFSTLYAVQLIRALVPAMRERGWGRVLNISSGAAFKPMAFHPEYSAAKLALHTVACSLSRELGDCGVTVNTLISGLVMTDNTRAMMLKTAQAHGFTETGVALERRVLLDIWRSAIPLARAGRVEELAAAASFLVSEHASYITGASLRIDGGGAGYVG